MKILITLVTCCLLATYSALANVAGTGTSPNILIIYADDLGYGDLSIQNPDSKIPTPHLDALAQASMRFTDGHSSSGICTPSRYALLTGRHHWRKFHGIVKGFGKSVFDSERLTLPEMLQMKGYHTAAIGKWHLGWDWDAIRKTSKKKRAEPPEAFDWSQPIPDGPLAHGFDHYFGDAVINFPPYCWIEDDRVTQVPDTIMDSSLWEPLKEGDYEFRPGPMLSGWDPYENLPTLTQRGVAYIHKQAKSQAPFFLYFALPSPHAPIIPNDQFEGKSHAGAYGDFVYETDYVCGQLLSALEESGQAANTLVIFTADNGAEHFAYARDEKFDHWSSAPLRGAKRDIYEGGHRVPFLIRWPGVIQAGQISDALVSQIDLMATLAAIVDYPLPTGQAEDSHNLLPLLKGDRDSVRSTHIHNTFAREYAIRHGDWVLIDTKSGYKHKKYSAQWEQKHGYPADDQQAVELYNLKRDIGQRQNVAAEYPEMVRKLQGLLQQIRAAGFSAPDYERR
jgi:arylsulfatase A